MHLAGPIATGLLIAALACGGSEAEPDAGSPPDTAAEAVAPDTAVTLVGTLPDGGPMPPAASTGGIPPYAGASVHTSRQQTSEMRSFEAYTPDEWTTVVAWYDSQLGPPEWSRVLAEEIVIYEKGEDEAAITVSAWAGESLNPGVADYMREARTAIGAAWRP
ncbi:MAG TPA: hypothetical protein VFS53_03930 [Gemmatimonadota bacterium]|nr:hypothetical protein [Gemmatimonadota bacterium]